MNNKILITGTGRAGSLWAANVLNAMNVKCGHQNVFRHEHVLGETEVDWSDYQADSSYEAVPMLDRIKARKVLIVRRPEKVIRSWVHKGAFGPDMREAFVMLSKVLDRHFPKVLKRRDPTGQAAQFWHDWNRYALDRTDVVLRLEELAPRDLLAACGLRGNPDVPGANASNPKKIKLKIPKSLQADVDLLAKELGY